MAATSIVIVPFWEIGASANITLSCEALSCHSSPSNFLEPTSTQKFEPAVMFQVTSGSSELPSRAPSAPRDVDFYAESTAAAAAF